MNDLVIAGENSADAPEIVAANALVPIKPDRAAELAAEFKSKLLAVDATRAAYKEMVLELGRLAVEMKEVVPHGQWADYCKRQLGKDASTILDYRDIYLGRADIKPESTSIREMKRDIEECNLPPQRVPNTKVPKHEDKSGARPGFEFQGIPTGTHRTPCTRRDHVHRLDLGWGMPPCGVINTRNSFAWLPRAAAWRDAISRRHNPAPKKGRPPEPLEPGSDAALAELLCRWCCPAGGRVLDTRPARARQKAVEYTGREYLGLGKAQSISGLDLLLVHLDREAAFDVGDLMQALKQDRFICVIATDVRDVTRAIIEFSMLGATLAGEAVLLMPTPQRDVKSFITARYFNPAHKHLLIFAKGDIAAAVAHCPQLQDDDLCEFAHFRPERFSAAQDDKEQGGADG
jgi:hypothetical protein